METLNGNNLSSSLHPDTLRPKMEHRVKSWPSFFEPTVAGVKTHDVRRMGDRDYRIGDTLRLMEFDPGKTAVHGT
jgi:hypothetical protein